MLVVTFKVFLCPCDGFFVVEVRATGFNISKEFGNSLFDLWTVFGWLDLIVVELNPADGRTLEVVVSLGDDILDTVFLNPENGRFSVLSVLIFEPNNEVELWYFILVEGKNEVLEYFE